MTQYPQLLGKIFHAELKIGDLNLYISNEEQQPSFDSIKFVAEIFLEGQAHFCFEKIVKNGKLISGFTKMPYGPTIAEADDQFGIRWNVVIC